MNTKSLLFVLSISLLMLAMPAMAQLELPRPSPMCEITQKVGLGEVKIAYSRPGVKGRKIFGDLVPYGKMWRTGANSPTKITFSDDVKVEGKDLKAGTYSLITIPGEREWEIIFNTDSKGRGVFSYNEAEDVLRVKVKPFSLTPKIESFMIYPADLEDNSAAIAIAWENTGVKFTVSTEIEEEIEAQIKQVLDPNRDAGTYYQIASYYYGKGQNLEEAHNLINKSVEMAPRYWTMHLQAKIKHMLKDKKGAMAAAEKSLGMAKEAGNQDYVRLNEKLIADIKK